MGEESHPLFANSVQGAYIQTRDFNKRPLEMPTKIKAKE